MEVFVEPTRGREGDTNGMRTLRVLHTKDFKQVLCIVLWAVDSKVFSIIYFTLFSKIKEKSRARFILP
jgi:hypothetical protein